MFSPQAYLILNVRKPPFDNVKVRQALMHALNRKMIIKNIFFGLGKVSTGPFVATELYYDSNVPKYEHNLKKAKQLMKESGIKAGAYTIRQLGFPYGRSEARRVGKEWVCKCRSRWSPYH